MMLDFATLKYAKYYHSRNTIEFVCLQCDLMRYDIGLIVVCQLQARSFLENTQVDALAVCIGNVHGKYPPSGPNLDLNLLEVFLTTFAFS